MYAKLYLDRGSSFPEGNCRNQAVTLKTPGPEHDECYRDVSPIGRQFAFCTIQEPGANAGENPAANLNDLVGSSSNFEDIPAIHSVSVIEIFRQLRRCHNSRGCRDVKQDERQHSRGGRVDIPKRKITSAK